MDAANLTNVTTHSVATQALSAAAPQVSGLATFFTVFLPAIAFRFWDLLIAPFLIPELQWVAIPLVITFVATEIYFFRNVDEELSWNAALTNGLVLLYVAIDLTRALYPGSSPLGVLVQLVHAFQTGQGLDGLVIVLFVAALGLFVALVNFFHLLPRKVAYKIAGHAPVTYIAYVASVLVYTKAHGGTIPLDGAFVVAATILFALLLVIIFTIQRSGIRSFQKLRGGD